MGTIAVTNSVEKSLLSRQAIKLQLPGRPAGILETVPQ